MIRPERFAKGTYHKLHHRSTGPFKILKRLGSNAYHIEVPYPLQLSPVFNVKYLTKYVGHHDDTSDPIPHPLVSLPPSIKPRDEIKASLEDQIVSTQRGGYQKILVKWKNRLFQTVVATNRRSTTPSP
jgi:hypothetical protein